MTVSNQIIEVLNAICDKFGLAIDWSSQNILPYMQELTTKIVNYEFWTSIITIAIPAIIFILSLLGDSKISPSVDLDCDTKEVLTFILSIIVITSGTLFILMLCFETYDIITCLTFPEKIILDYAVNVLNP